MTSDKDVAYEHGQTVAPARVSKRRKCGNHCKRFWWAHLIVFCCIVVLVVCLVIFVGVPNIAQDKINDAKLEIQGVNILDTEPEKFRMEVNSTITTDGSIHADVDAFTGEMYLEDVEPHTPFASLDFPKTNADKHQNVNVSQEVNIKDMDAFVKFNTWFVNNETVKITIKGDTKVKPAGLDRKSSVTFSKTLEVKALNLFKGTKVLTDTAELSFTKDKDGKNFHGQVDIPNASDFTLDIGNVTFSNAVEDTAVGTLYINNLLLHPGSNIVNVSATMDQSKILGFLQTSKYCKGDNKGIIPMKLLGKEVTNNGEDLTYFAKALGSANQTVNIDIAGILGTDIPCKDDE